MDLAALRSMGLQIESEKPLVLNRKLVHSSISIAPVSSKVLTSHPKAIDVDVAKSSAKASEPRGSKPQSNEAKAEKKKEKGSMASSKSQAKAAPAKSAGKALLPFDYDQEPPRIIAAGQPLSGLPTKRGFTCMSYNVLLPNSKDGWWIYKYYREDGDMTSWRARQALLKNQILTVGADVICVQEVSDLSFEEDFAFLASAGYSSIMHTKGRLRPATFWLAKDWQEVSVLCKDRTIVTCLRRLEGEDAGTIVFVVNAHLSAGPQADRRLRQMHEALETVGKEAKKLGLDPEGVPVVVCGDFNSQNRTGVRELLVSGEVGPDFRESGDPTEKGQEGNQITAKVKRHNLSRFLDASELAFKENVPATILATNIDSKMAHSDGAITKELADAVKAAFRKCCSGGRDVILREDAERYLRRVNKELGRGSEYRYVQAVWDRKGEEVLGFDDFLGLYKEEVEEGKFWGVEHDLRVINGSGMAIPSEGPCELRFDYIYFSSQTLQLVGVQDPLTEEQRRRIWNAPWDVLPNSWHPSDHLPVAACFALR